MAICTIEKANSIVNRLAEENRLQVRRRPLRYLVDRHPHILYVLVVRLGTRLSALLPTSVAEQPTQPFSLAAPPFSSLGVVRLFRWSYLFPSSTEDPVGRGGGRDAPDRG